MSLESGKHIEKEIDGTRCRVLESGITEDRMNFLKSIMEYNGYTVKFAKELKKSEDLPDTYIIGVTDIVFNPVIAVYERQLRTHNNEILTVPYWKQQTEESKGWYWKFRKQ